MSKRSLEKSQSIEDSQVYDVLIIGAGVSGATAAYTLKKLYSSLSILVIEGKDRVGGRTQTVELNCSKPGKKVKLDAGGQWVADTQEVITEILKELKIETYPQYDTGTKIIECDGESIKHSGSLLNMPFFTLVQLQCLISRLNSNNKKIDTLDPFRKLAIAESLDGKNLEQFLLKDMPFSHMISETCKGMINAAIRVVYGCEMNQINSLYTSMFIKSGGSFESLTLTDKGCAQEKRVKNGTQQISQKLIDLANCELKLNTALVGVVQASYGHDLVTVKTLNTVDNRDVVYKARYVISSIPVNQYVNVDFRPELPHYKKNVFKFMQMGNLTKFIVTYKEAFWRSNGFSGEVVSDGSIQTTELLNKPSIGPINAIYDGTSSDGEPALIGFIGGRSAVEWLNRTEIERKAEIIASLVRYFGKKAADPVDFFEKNWSEEKFSGGCPVVNVTTSGVMKDYARATREPFLNFHFCGTESATKWQGYLDGAAESGIRAANEVLYRMSDMGDSKAKHDYEKTYYFQREKAAKLREEETNRFSFFDIGFPVGLSMMLVFMILVYVCVFISIDFNLKLW